MQEGTKKAKGSDGGSQQQRMDRKGGQRFRQARTHDKRQWCPQKWVTTLQNLGGDKKKVSSAKTPDSEAHSSKLESTSRLHTNHVSKTFQSPSGPRVIQGNGQICTITKNKISPPQKKHITYVPFPFQVQGQVLTPIHATTLTPIQIRNPSQVQVHLAIGI